MSGPSAIEPARRPAANRDDVRRLGAVPARQVLEHVAIELESAAPRSVSMRRPSTSAMPAYGSVGRAGAAGPSVAPDLRADRVDRVLGRQPCRRVLHARRARPGPARPRLACRDHAGARAAGPARRRVRSRRRQAVVDHAHVVAVGRRTGERRHSTSARNASTASAGGRGFVRGRRRRPTDACRRATRPRHGTAVSIRPDGPGAAIAMSRAGRSSSTFIARSSGGAPVVAERADRRSAARRRTRGA